jgi:transcriptional regulator with XRE-family HTH domain
MGLIGKNIKGIRKEKKLTQEDLAEKCDLQTSYLAGVERGERNITLQTLEKIAKGLDESPEYIFNFDKINIDEDFLSVKEQITVITSLLSKREPKEVELILNLTKNIFDTYKK